MLTNLAFLLLRMMLGLTIAAHGSQKLFGWFGGGGLKNTSVFFEKQGFKPAWVWLGLACVGELGGGLSLAAGLLTPLGAAGVFGAMHHVGEARMEGQLGERPALLGDAAGDVERFELGEERHGFGPGGLGRRIEKA